jgi:hypothetical protein
MLHANPIFPEFFILIIKKICMDEKFGS